MRCFMIGIGFLATTLAFGGRMPATMLTSGRWTVKLDDGIFLMQGGGEVARARLNGWVFEDWQPVGEVAYEAFAHPVGKTSSKAIKGRVELQEGRLRLQISRLDSTVRLPEFIMPIDKGLAGSVVEMDGMGYTVPLNRDERVRFPHAQIFDFFRKDSVRRFTVDVKTSKFADLRDASDIRQDSPFILFMIPQEGNALAADIDLSVSDAPRGLSASIGTRPGGVDPVLARPADGRNLIENPGFEGGLALWAISGDLPSRPDATGRCGWRLSDRSARSGVRSAEYTSVKGCNAPMLGAQAVSLRPNARYTLSFYAKSDTPDAALTLWTINAVWGVFPCSKRIKVGTEWTRYSFTFKAPSPFVQFFFGDRWSEGGAKDAQILLDDVQCELSETASTFVQKPGFAHFENQARNGVFFDDEATPVKLVVNNCTDRETNLTVSVKIMDMNGRLFDTRTFSFVLASHAERIEALDLSSVKLNGLIRLCAELKIGDFSDVFFGRLARCKDLSGQTPSILYLYHQENGPSLSDIRWRERLGYRGTLSFSPPSDPALYRNYASNGWTHIFTVTEGSDAPVKVFEQKMTEEDWTRYLAWIDARLKPFAGLPVWYKTMNEPDIPRRSVWTPDDHVRVVQHIHDVVKASSPSARILTPDPYHSGREAQEWLDQFFAVGGKDVVDALAIHTYGARPEEPDLDNHIQTLQTLKAKHGLAGIPILFTEGEGVPIYTIDAIGLSPLRGYLTWRLGMLSQDVGPSEALGAATMARRLLITLKNAAQVKSYLNWTDDFDPGSRQPLATLAAANTVLGLLGEAKFQNEQTLGDNVRVYVFTMSAGSPVAALWCHDLKVDRGEMPPPLASLALPDSGWRLLDMMGNPLVYTQRNSHVEFPLGSQPVYLIGDHLSLDAMNAALEKSNIGGGGLKSVDMTVRLQTLSQATLQIANKRACDIAGTLVASWDGKPVLTQSVELKGKAKTSFAMPLPGKRNALNQGQVVLTFQDRESGISTTYTDDLRWLAVTPMTKVPTFTGNLADWAEASAFTLDGKASVTTLTSPWQGVDDASVTWRFGYDSDGLCLCAEVRDQSFITEKNIKSAWCGDSLQLYFDLFADGHDKPGLGYDSNDESIWAAQVDGQAKLYRDYTPEWQVAFVKGGMMADGRIVVTRQAGVTLYEMRLPISEISPLAMKPGTSFGLGLLVNDSDVEGVRKQTVSNTQSGTEPHGHPELWPLAVLTDHSEEPHD